MGNVLKIAVLLLLIIGCETANRKEKNTLKKFDYKKYSSGERIIESTDSITELSEGDEYYREVKRKKNSKFSVQLLYYKQNFGLKSKTKFFDGLPTGIMKSFDESGNITEVRNYDKDFKFSIDDLGGLLERRYKTNINNENIVVGRGKHSYTVYIHPVGGGNYKEIIIDGKTGEILKDTMRMAEE